jgi:hypothetical protein
MLAMPQQPDVRSQLMQPQVTAPPNFNPPAQGPVMGPRMPVNGLAGRVLPGVGSVPPQPIDPRMMPGAPVNSPMPPIQGPYTGLQDSIARPPVDPRNVLAARVGA